MKEIFFVVTKTSVYKAMYNKESSPYPVVEKIALKEDSKFPIGYRLQGGPLLSIGKWLMMYVPEGGGITSNERRIELVNTRYWGDCTSPIIALFDLEAEAMKCFNSTNLEPADERWLESSKRVLQSIEENHPAFVVSHYYDLEFGYVSEAGV